MISLVYIYITNFSGLRGEISKAGPGSPFSSVNISTHIWILPCSIPGWAGLYKERVSTCSGTKSNLLRRWRANLSRTAPYWAALLRWSFSVSSDGNLVIYGLNIYNSSPKDFFADNYQTVMLFHNTE